LQRPLKFNGAVASDLAGETQRDKGSGHVGGDQNESDRDSFVKKVAQGRSARAYAILRINLSHGYLVVWARLVGVLVAPRRAACFSSLIMVYLNHGEVN
jgi:hypothetical protein